MSIQRGDVPVVGDYRSFALKRAQSLGVFTSAPAIFEDNFQNMPGDAGSQWQQTVPGSGGSVTGIDTAGGVARLDSLSVANIGAQPQVGKATGVKPSMILDPGAAGSRWYLLWTFSLATAVDANAICSLNLTPTSGGANQLLFGLVGLCSATNFCGTDLTVANFVASSIAPGALGAWHFMEAWQIGVSKQVFFRFDNEATKTLTLTNACGHPCCLALESYNGATATSRQMDVDHVVVLMPGNVTLPATT